MEDKLLWIRRCKSMVLDSFNYMIFTRDWIRSELRWYDSEWGDPEKVIEVVDEYVNARDDWMSWKKQLLEEYGWKK